MTNKELANKIRQHNGKVQIPMLSINGVHHVFALKGDLIELLKCQGENTPSDYYILEVDTNNIMTLDVK